MQYRLAGDWPETPDVYRPYDSGYLAPAAPEASGSAVVLDDGRVMYVWSQRAAADTEIAKICLGYADDVTTFFTSDSSVTLDRTLIEDAGVLGGGRSILGRVFADPFYGSARLWLSLSGGGVATWTYDASIEAIGMLNPPTVPVRVAALYTSVDQGDTWQWNTNLWEGSTFALTGGSTSWEISQFESAEAGASWVTPYPNVVGVPTDHASFPLTSRGAMLTVYTRQNERPAASKRLQSMTAKSLDGGQTWEDSAPPMYPDVAEPGYWDPYTLPTTDPDTTWLDQQHVPSGLSTIDVGEIGGNTVSSGTFAVQTYGGSSTNRRSFWIYAGLSFWKPKKDNSGVNITLDRDVLPTGVGSMFTIHGDPGHIYHFCERENNTVLGRSIYTWSEFTSPDIDYTASDDATTGAAEMIWTGLFTQASSGRPYYVQKVGDVLGFFFHGRVIGLNLFTPRCHPLPALHVPYKAWFDAPSKPPRGSGDPTSRRRQYEQNWKRVETWASLTRRNGNTLDLLNLPRATHRSPVDKFEQRWLTVERWTRTLCNGQPLHIPFKRQPERDEENWLTLERWVKGVPGSDAPF